MPIITDLKEKGKVELGRIPEGILTVVIVVLASTGSFGMGYLSGKEAGGGEVIIQQPVVSEAETKGEVAGNAFVPVPTTSVKKSVPKPTMSSGGQYVASKKGTKYHLPWCPGAKAMNEENKIFFNSKEEAEAAGYTPAANCKGI